LNDNGTLYEVVVFFHREILDAVVPDHFRLADLLQTRGGRFQDCAGDGLFGGVFAHLRVAAGNGKPDPFSDF
jgi:hypothetical protein